MAASSPNIIRKSACPEHLCKMLRIFNILERVDSGELRMVKDRPTKRKNPERDFKGQLCVAHQMSRVFDDRMPKGDPRYKVATLHQHITEAGHPGYSGRYDPK